MSLAEEAAPRCPQCGQNLLPSRVGGFLRRSLAAGLDLALLAVTAGPLSYFIHRIAPGPPLLPEDSRGMDAFLLLLAGDLGPLFFRAAPFLVMVFTYVLIFTATSGRSLGQQLLGLRIVDAHGRRLSPFRSLVRVAGLMLALLPGGLGWLWSAFDREKRAFHDHLAGSYVLLVPRNVS